MNLKTSKTKIGIYIGWQGLTFVELSARKITNSATIPYSLPKTEKEIVELTQALTDSANFVELIHKGLSQLNVKEFTSVDAYLSLPQKDALVRFFSMPYLAVSEIEKSLPFEIRKYIPFKLEEMQYVSQKFHKIGEKRIDVLWVGIKKDIFNQYSSILQKAGIKVKILEPTSLSLIRIIYNKIPAKNESVAIIEASNLESNIAIINKGIPIFTREIKFSSPISEKESSELMKLNNELRMMCDFYRRQYTLGEIKKIVLISDAPVFDVFKEMVKDLGISLEYYHPKDIIESNKDINIDTLRAAGVALANTLKVPYNVNLYTKAKKKGLFAGLSKENAVPISKKAVAVTIGICASLITAAIFTNNIRIKKLKDEFVKINKEQPQLSGEYANLPAVDLKKEIDNIHRDLNTLKEASKESSSIVKRLTTLTNVLPSGVWLDNLSYAVEGLNVEIKLSGFAYKGDQREESRIIDTFVSALKADSDFSSSFKIIQLSSRIRSRIGEYEAEKFSIICSP